MEVKNEMKRKRQGSHSTQKITRFREKQKKQKGEEVNEVEAEL